MSELRSLGITLFISYKTALKQYIRWIWLIKYVWIWSNRPALPQNNARQLKNDHFGTIPIFSRILTVPYFDF